MVAKKRVVVAFESVNAGLGFHNLVLGMQKTYEETHKDIGPQLFRIEGFKTVYDEVFIANLPEENRQWHNCSCCRDFMRQYGCLVRITEDGKLVSAFWNPDNVPEFYQKAVKALSLRMSQAKVRDIFYTDQVDWGFEEKGGFEHLYCEAMHENIYVRDNGERADKTPNQYRAHKREHYKSLVAGLKEYNRETVVEALRLIKSDSLIRTEKVLPSAEFFFDLIEATANVGKRERENMIWLAVSLAPHSFCNPKSSVVGTLYDDIKDGLNTSAIKARFNAKLNGLNYMRPTAAPKAGAVANAEKHFEENGLARSLERRFAHFEELELLWQPQVQKETKRSGGLFAHLKTKTEVPQVREVETNVQTVTAEKFMNKVAPEALEIELYVPYRAHFIGTVSAVHMDAPPILQWDTEEKRNPVSQYIHHHGSIASDWQLESSTWVKVKGISNYPAFWNGQTPTNHSRRIFCVLEGQIATKLDGGNALFPEILKGQFHQYRQVIEAYSKSAVIADPEAGTANGLGLVGARLRVRTKLGWFTYTVDRED